MADRSTKGRVGPLFTNRPADARAWLDSQLANREVRTVIVLVADEAGAWEFCAAGPRDRADWALVSLELGRLALDGDEAGEVP